MTVTDEIARLFEPDALKAHLRDMMQDWAMKLELPEAYEIERWALLRAASIVESLRDVTLEDDDSEARGLLPAVWLELRFEWIRYNTQMQYQCLQAGEAELGLMLRGSFLSAVIARLEACLDPRTQYWCSKLAADVNAPLDDLQRRTARMLDLTHAANRAEQDAVERLLVMRDTLANSGANLQALAHVDRAVGDTMNLLSEAVAFTVRDVHDAVQRQCIAAMATSPLLIVHSAASTDMGLRLPPELAVHLLEIVQRWLAAIVATSVEPTAQARGEVGKTAHLNFDAELRRTGERVTVHLRDDGLGRAELPPLPPGLRAYAPTVTVTREPGRGSELTVVTAASRVHTFVVFALHPAGERPMHVALEASAVVRLDGADEQVAPLLLDGRRRVDPASKRTLPVVDLGARVAGPHAAGGPLFVHIALEDTRQLALRVHAVVGLVRATVQIAGHLQSGGLVRGFVLHDGHTVPLIDLVRLSDEAVALPRRRAA